MILQELIIPFWIYAPKLIAALIASMLIFYLWKPSLKKSLISTLISYLVFLLILIAVHGFSYIFGTILGFLGAIFSYQFILKQSWGKSFAQAFTAIALLYVATWITVIGILY